jgi:hypothetical protein
MKVLFQDYTFDPINNQIIFNTTDVITLEQILVITNVKANDIIYNFADPNKGGSISGNVIYLNYDVSGMGEADPLQIFLEIPMNPSTDESVVLLRRLVQLLTPIGVQDAQQRQRVTVENSSVAVSTINSLNTLANVDARFPIIDQARNTFANGIRQNLIY